MLLLPMSRCLRLSQRAIGVLHLVEKPEWVLPTEIRPDDRHKSSLVGSFRLNEERYFQLVFFHFSVVFSKFPLLAKVQMNKYS